VVSILNGDEQKKRLREEFLKCERFARRELDEDGTRDLNHVGDDEEENKLRFYTFSTTCL
jgi:hypothetical protein